MHFQFYKIILFLIFCFIFIKLIKLPKKAEISPETRPEIENKTNSTGCTAEKLKKYNYFNIRFKYK